MKTKIRNVYPKGNEYTCEPCSECENDVLKIMRVVITSRAKGKYTKHARLSIQLVSKCDNCNNTQITQLVEMP